MCLLDRVTAWSAAGVACGASSHLSPDNPLRRDGRLGAICGIEYGLQAAALHGALALHGAGPNGGGAARHDGGGAATAPRPGYLAALREVTLHVDHLDDPRFGILQVTAATELQAANGSIYRFSVASEAGAPLLEGQASIAFPDPCR